MRGAKVLTLKEAKMIVLDITNSAKEMKTLGAGVQNNVNVNVLTAIESKLPNDQIQIIKEYFLKNGHNIGPIVCSEQRKHLCLRIESMKIDERIEIISKLKDKKLSEVISYALLKVCHVEKCENFDLIEEFCLTLAIEIFPEDDAGERYQFEVPKNPIQAQVIDILLNSIKARETYLLALIRAVLKSIYFHEDPSAVAYLFKKIDKAENVSKPFNYTEDSTIGEIIEYMKRAQLFSICYALSKSFLIEFA